MATFRTDGWTDGQWRAEVLGCPGGANEVLGCPGQSKFLLFCPEEDLNSPKKMSIFSKIFSIRLPKFLTTFLFIYPNFQFSYFSQKLFQFRLQKFLTTSFCRFYFFHILCFTKLG